MSAPKFAANVLGEVVERANPTITASFVEQTPTVKDWEAVSITNASSTIVLHVSLGLADGTAPTEIDFYVSPQGPPLILSGGRRLRIWAKMASGTQACPIVRYTYRE